MTDLSRTLEELRTRLHAARRITVLTGAGVSAASGVPTFRGAGGLWRSFRAEDLATPEAFVRDPRLVWEWYDWRRSIIAACSPNPAHDALARWTERDGVTLITQNVDGLHERAGARDVIRFHGSIWHLRCAQGCGVGASWENRQVPLPQLPARCPGCAGLARPDVVWFGEGLDPEILTRAFDACHCDVFLSVGTSSIVHPAAALAGRARALGALTVESNPEPAGRAAGLDVVLAMAAEVALPALST
jgi:NAD-dependent deacetylase